MVVAAADAQGRFAFAVDEPGGYGLRVIGSHHEVLDMPLILTSPDPVTLDIRLAASRFSDEADSVWVHAASSEEAVLMRKRPDGTFAARVVADADTVAYRILGIRTRSSGRSYLMAGTDHDRVALDRSRSLWGRYGPYFSVVKAPGDSVEVVFEPGRLPSGPGRPHVSGSPPLAADIAMAYFDMEERRRRISASMQCGPFRADAVTLDQDLLKEERTAVRALIDGAGEPLLRQWLLLQYMDGMLLRGEEAKTIAQAILAEVPFDSPFWSFEAWSRSFGAANLVAGVSRALEDYERVTANVDDVIARNRDPWVLEQFLESGVDLAHGEGDEARKWHRYTKLRDEYGDSGYYERARRQYGPDRSLQVGNPVPEFSFESLDHPDRSFTSGSLRGRIYLMDFWGAWCGPCIQEMPSLTETHDWYRASGLEILSVALMDEREAIARFQRERFAMPWMHTLISREDDEAVRSAFEITGFPRPILVDAEGIIVAIDDDPRDGMLMEAVAAALADG